MGFETTHACLEREVASREYQLLLQTAQSRDPSLRRFSTWTELIDLVHASAHPEDAMRDVVDTLVAAHTQDRDPRWHTVLLALYLPRLLVIWRKKQRWEVNAEFRWANTLEAFHHSVCTLDVSQRNGPLVWQIVNGTIDRLRTEHRYEKRRSGRTKSLDVAPDDDGGDSAPKGKPKSNPKPEPSTVPDWDLGREEAETRIDLDMKLRLLRRLWQSGRISGTYFPVLLATQIYGKSIEQYAREAGISYDTAKRQRQRAEAIWNRLTRRIP